MSELVLTDAGAVAMLEGLLARGAASRLHFLSATSVTLAVLVLASPCGEIVDNKLVLAQADPEGDLIVANGLAASALWYSYDTQSRILIERRFDLTRATTGLDAFALTCRSFRSFPEHRRAQCM